MVDFGNSTKGRWVCPNDRQLALRAKLRTGWSVKTHQVHGQQDTTAPLNDAEQDAIRAVIKRAEQIELTEQERVGKLVDRVENMKRNAMGNGTNQCILCGDHFGMLGSQSLLCHDCKKLVCHKCGIETFSSQKEIITLCKICSETREMWKKSGAWFFKGIPKYKLPEKKVHDTIGKYGARRIQRPGLEKNSWSRTGSIARVSEEEESSSEDELTRRSRQTRSRQLDEPDTGGATERSPSIKHGNCVTFDLSSVGGSNSIHSQRSESLSLPSEGDIQNDVYSDTERPVSTRDYYRSGDIAGSTVSFADSASGVYPSYHSRTTTALVHSETGWESLDSETNHSGASYHHPHGRRDSQLSSLSRDWQGSEDRASLASSSTSGHRSTGEGHETTAPRGESAQLGTLELSLLYDQISMALHCTLHRAIGLKAMDINGLSDPFCRLNLLPTEGKSNRLRTKTIHKTRNPEFNENLTFYGVTTRDLSYKILHILILDDDKFGHDFIGEARVTLARTQPDVSRYLKVNLEKRSPVAEEDEVWGSDTWTRGQILVTLCYSTRKRALIVGIVRCVNLAPMDNNGFSDPFVKLRLKPDLHHRKCKTSVKWKNLNPTFNEEFVFDTKMTDLPKQALEISVWDRDYGKSNDYLGGLQLGWHSKGERLKHWVDMIKFPDHKHEGWHNLGEDLLPE